jgi:hypothetical protein
MSRKNRYGGADADVAAAAAASETQHNRQLIPPVLLLTPKTVLNSATAIPIGCLL